MDLIFCVPQVLFIDEVHMLDIECFAFLNRALENELSPLVIMASNRGTSRIRGTKFASPHGLPVDLLDRVLIVSTKPYEEDDVQQITKIRCLIVSSQFFVYIYLVYFRCQEEDVTLTEQALMVLTSMSQATTLRYALNLISCAQVLATKRKSEQVDVDDLRRAYSYFMDEKRSVQWLKEQQGNLMFEEVDGPAASVNRMDED